MLMPHSRTKFTILIASAFFYFLPNQAFAQQKFKIGVSVPLTGPVSEYGVAIANGMKLALKEIDGADKLEIVFQDNQYDAKTAISAYENLKTEKPDALYVWGAPPSSVSAALIERDKIPTIAATGKPSSLKDKKYSINYMPGPEKFISVLLKNPKIADANKIALVSNDTPYTMGLRTAFRSSISDSSRIVLDETTDHGTLDYRALVLKVKKSGSETLGLLLLEPDLGIFCKSAREAHYFPQVFGSDQFESKSSVEHCSPFLDKVVYANHTQPQSFVDRYKKEFGNDVQIADASAGYAALQILFHVLQSAKSPDEIMDNLRKLSKFSTEKGVVSTNFKDGVHYLDWEVVEKIIEK